MKSQACGTRGVDLDTNLQENTLCIITGHKSFKTVKHDGKFWPEWASVVYIAVRVCHLLGSLSSDNSNDNENIT